MDTWSALDENVYSLKGLPKWVSKELIKQRDILRHYEEILKLLEYYYPEVFDSIEERLYDELQY